MATEQAKPLPWYVDLLISLLLKLGVPIARTVVRGRRAMDLDVWFEKARKTVDVLAATAGTLVAEQLDLLRDAAGKGVRIRFLLADFGDPAVASTFASSVQITVALAMEEWRTTRQSLSDAPPNVRVRFLKPNVLPMHAAWIRDREYAAVTIWSNAGIRARKTFGLSERDARRLAEDFDTLWDAAQEEPSSHG